MLTFVHISDTHVHPSEGYRRPYAAIPPIKGTKALIQQINALPFTPDFVLHTGDIAYDPDESVYPFIQTLFSEIRVPIHYLAGNHDHRHAMQTVLQGMTPPQENPYSTFEQNGVQIVFLDSNAPADPPRGRIPEEQLDWLDAICSSDDDRPLMIAVHHNPIECDVEWMDSFMKIENGETFHAIVRQARDRLRGVFHGHIHQEMDVFRDGVLYSSAMSPWCSFMSHPNMRGLGIVPDTHAQAGFSVVSITPERTTIRRHAFNVV